MKHPLLKSLAKWAVSIGLGVLFVWVAGRNWPLGDVFKGAPLLAGRFFAMVPASLGAFAGPLDEAARARIVAAGGWTLDLLYLVPFVILLCSVHFARVIRWDYLLRPIARFDFSELNRVAAVGFMAMFVFPFRLGELVRPYLLRERHKGTIRMTEGLAVIVVERLTDGLLVSLFLVAVLFRMPDTYVESYQRVRYGAWVALMVFVGGLVALGLMFVVRERLSAFFERFRVVTGTAAGRRFLSILKAFLEALQVLPSIRYYLLFVLMTAVYWSLVGLGYNVLAAGFELPVPVLGSFAMMATSVVGMMIPNSPANVGSFWVFLLLPLELYIGDRAFGTQAIAYALVAWGVTVLQYLVFAGWFMLRGQVSFSSVSHAHIEE